MSESNSKSTKLVNEEMLRAFAQGQLDEATEDEIVALLDKNPELQAKVAAISIAPVMDKMRAHSQVIGARSLSSQVGGETIIPAAGISNSEFDLPTELSSLSEYRVIRELGRGGMGVVYLAHNKYTDRREVLKVLNERLIENEEAKERFLQEIKVTARLDHSCIVKALGVREVGKTLAFCMEFIKGRDLHGFISEHGKLPVHLACRIAIDISTALQHAMNQGVLHRDIKPSNVMLCKGENGKARAKVLDFGLGRIGDREESNGLTEFGSLLGTLEYISPEQCINAANVDIRADIYSLGCTLYHMLVGHPPFSGTKGELILAHSRDLPPAVNLIQPTVPRELGGIVSRMLAKQPDRRYQRPQDVADALQPFMIRKEKRPKPKVPPETDGPGQAVKRDTAVDLPVSEPSSLAKIDAIASLDAALPQITAEPQSVLETQRRRKRIRPSWWAGKRKRIIIWIAATLVLAVVLGFVLSIRTSKGTIVFADLPADAEVIVDGDKVEVTWAEGKASITVEFGERAVQVVRDGVAIEAHSFTVNGPDEIKFIVRSDSVVADLASEPSKQSDSMPRVLWVHESGFFKLTHEDYWTEYAPDGTRNTYIEVERTPQFIDLRPADDTGNRVRLSETTSDIVSDDGLLGMYAGWWHFAIKDTTTAAKEFLATEGKSAIIVPGAQLRGDKTWTRVSAAFKRGTNQWHRLSITSREGFEFAGKMTFEWGRQPVPINGYVVGDKITWSNAATDGQTYYGRISGEVITAVSGNGTIVLQKEPALGN